MRLPASHGWRSQPHHKILVLDRGAVRLEYPEKWVVSATEDCVRIHDKKPPDDDCVLGVSYHCWPAVGRGLSVATLVRTALEGDERPFTAIDPIVEEKRMDLDLAWVEGRFVDAREQRAACARLCIARREEIQALITFDFWATDLERCDRCWKAFLASLELAEWVADPMRGPAVS